MFNTVTLEISLKPFKKTDDEYIRSVCREVFSQWRPLLKGRKNIGIMFWTSDGSEILDYAGRLDDEFEWCSYIGTANLPHLSEGEAPYLSLHKRSQPYTKCPPVMTYRILQKIVKTFREEGRAAFPDANILIGDTFDIGPEFAVSDFKYRRHNEICKGRKLDCGSFVDATLPLHADDRPYAAYPTGIPEGTLFGTFLGKQSAKFLPDMGFDFLWLSNGLGFSSNPWDVTGKLFDGKNYYPERLGKTRSDVFAFWKLFRDECDVPLWTRGTNNSVGIDYATDGVPLYDIYKAGFNILPPPNSPWAALNDNYGLELMGHMTRIAELPSDSFLFRYYLHDPWWVNSPWYDRYNGQPMDIYLPMAIARISKEGKCESAGMFNILSIDNSFGNMPDSCVNESVPHILKAEKDAPDEPSPLVWVYPMREYTTAEGEAALRRMNEGDRFICNAINNGLPLSTVVSTDNFIATDESVYDKCILLSPVPESQQVLQRLAALSEKCGVIFYGSDEELAAVPEMKNSARVSTSSHPSALVEALGAFGITLRFVMKKSAPKPPCIAVSRSEGGYFFSVYNPDTTTDTHIKLPLGAPILMGGETEITEDGCAVYRFAKSEHRECRIFVKQKGGVISAKEAAPSNAVYRRKIRLSGLEDATVYFFPETDGKQDCARAAKGYQNSDETPIFLDSFRIEHDSRYGTYLVGEHIDGEILLMMEFPTPVN